jgi:phage FluMu protein Com
MTPATASEYIEIRCNKDNTLLFRARHVGSGEIEIKCRRCGEKRQISFPLSLKAAKSRPENKLRDIAITRN